MTAKLILLAHIPIMGIESLIGALSQHTSFALCHLFWRNGRNGNKNVIP